MHTKRGHYTPCFVDWHKLLVTKVTDPLVTFHKNIATLLVPVRVGGAHLSLNNGLLGIKLYMSLD